MVFRIMTAFGLLVAITTPVAAKEVANQYLSLEVPEDWECKLFGEEWFCQSSNSEKAREAQIVFRAKIQTHADSVENSQRKYSNPIITELGDSGRRMTSQVLHSRISVINRRDPDERWSDSLHFESEKENYFTRYFDTAEADLFVSVKFLVHKDKVSEYRETFERAASSLHAFRKSAVCFGDSSSAPDQIWESSSLRQKKDESWSLWRWLGFSR